MRKVIINNHLALTADGLIEIIRQKSDQRYQVERSKKDYRFDVVVKRDRWVGIGLKIKHREKDTEIVLDKTAWTATEGLVRMAGGIVLLPLLVLLPIFVVLGIVSLYIYVLILALISLNAFRFVLIYRRTALSNELAEYIKNLA
ncbi:MAG: hypothetical protein ACYC6Z_04525 [Thermoleophilia bacterium]